MYNCMICHLYIVLCVHHPSQISFHYHFFPLHLHLPPPPPFPLVITTLMSLFMRFFSLLNPYAFSTQPPHSPPLWHLSVCSLYLQPCFWFVLFCSLDSTYKWNHMALVLLHNGIVLSHKKERNLIICHSLDGLEEYYAKWSKPARERNLYYFINPCHPNKVNKN